MSKLDLRKEIKDKYIETFILLRDYAGDEPKILQLYRAGEEDGEGDYYIPSISHNCNLEVGGNIYDEAMSKWKPLTTINLNDYIIDVSLPKVGYRNKEDIAVYISHNPIKQWKRGFAHRQVKCGRHKSDSLSAFVSSEVDIEQMFFNVYPTIDVAIKEVADGIRRSSAFNEDYAIGTMSPSKAVFLYYRTSMVGVIDKDTEGYVCKLPADNAYLEEDIEQYIKCEVIKQ